MAVEILHYKSENLEMLKGWKTLLINSVVAIVAVAQASGLVDVVPPAYIAPAMAVLSFVNIWLRSMSDTPMMKSK